MELLLPLRGLGTSPACHLKTVTLVLLLVGLGPASGCITRSGQDAERVASKQGKEPEYHPQVKSKINFQSSIFTISFTRRIRMHQLLGRELKTLTVAMRRARSRLGNICCQKLKNIKCFFIVSFFVL